MNLEDVIKIIEMLAYDQEGRHIDIKQEIETGEYELSELLKLIASQLKSSKVR